MVAELLVRHSTPAALVQYLPTPRLFPGSPGLPQQDRVAMSPEVAMSPASLVTSSLVQATTATVRKPKQAREMRVDVRTCVMTRGAYQRESRCQSWWEPANPVATRPYVSAWLALRGPPALLVRWGQSPEQWHRSHRCSGPGWPAQCPRRRSRLRDVHFLANHCHGRRSG